MLVDRDTYAYLELLANGILPLQEWIKGKDYTPPNADTLPWRVGEGSLTLRHLGVIEFVVGLISESSGDEETRAYFATRAETPLGLSPHDDVAQWRALRNLSPDPAFGVTESDNLLMDVEGHPISRQAFYRTYLPLFRHTCDLAIEAIGRSVFDWAVFAKALADNSSPFWPKSLPRRSSTFVKQFGRDVLYAVLGMRNPVDPPWRDGVLIELGEHRRVGNAFTPEHAASVLKAFRAVFDPLLEKGDAQAEFVARSMFAPVGAPPITPREQQV